MSIKNLIIIAISGHEADEFRCLINIGQFGCGMMLPADIETLKPGDGEAHLRVRRLILLPKRADRKGGVRFTNPALP